MKRRDLLLLAGGLILLIILWLAPPVSTPILPHDDNHQQMFELVATQGKKAAEARCSECHNPQQNPLPAKHPATVSRCLFCHRLEK